MAKRKQNESGNVLPAVDIKVMVMQLADSARRLRDCGDFEGASDAVSTALTYSADAGMDARFNMALRKIQTEVGDPKDWGPKFNNPMQPKLKNRLLK